MAMPSTQYERELSRLKPEDGINGTSKAPLGYDFISTYGHGYLVVPMTDKYADRAARICRYGYKGALAYYLEEDCEKWAFLDSIPLSDIPAPDFAGTLAPSYGVVEQAGMFYVYSVERDTLIAGYPTRAEAENDADARNA